MDSTILDATGSLKSVLVGRQISGSSMAEGITMLLAV